MSLRTKVERLQRHAPPAEHQTWKLILAIVAIPDGVREIVTAPRNTSGSGGHAERVERECSRLAPALDAWGELVRQAWNRAAPDLDGDGSIPPEVWNSPRLRDLPIPPADATVLQEARRAVSAHESGTAADGVQRDALAVCAYAGHLALNLQRPVADLEARARRSP